MYSAKITLTSLPPETKFIFSILQKKGPITKHELILLTKMKLTTLNRFIKPLNAANLLLETGKGESELGRKPVLLDINPSRYWLIGIDLSRTYVQIVFTNLKLQIIEKRIFPMDATTTPNKTIQKMAQILNETMQHFHLDKQLCLGVGVGTVGPLEITKGMMLCTQNFPAPGWSEIPICSLVESQFELPVYLDNGANTALLSESLFGDGRNYRNILYINCGVGIRTGATSGANIVRTVKDAEDAFGHMVIDFDGEACNCGNYGCLECYASIPAIKTRFITELKKGRFSVIHYPSEKIDYQDICQAADRDGDALAMEVITSAATALGIGLANYINLLNPDLIILSGPLIHNSKLYYEICIQTALKKHYLNKTNKIAFSKGGFFGEQAIAVGAGALVIENSLKF